MPVRPKPPLRRALSWLRRHGLTCAAVVFSLAHLAGAFASPRPWAFALAWASLLSVLVPALGWRVLQARAGEKVALRLDVGLGLLALGGAFAAVQATGEQGSPLHPLVYLLAACFAVAPWPRPVALGLVLATVAQNALRYVCLDILATHWRELVVQAGFTALFALLYHLVIAARVWALRASERSAVARRLREVEATARRLRLLVVDRSRDRRGPGDEEELARKLLLGAVLEVERSVASILDSAQLALGAHAVALYWLSDDESSVSLRDGRCAAGLLAQGPVPAGNGLMGEVLREGQPVSRTGRIKGVTWYTRPVPVGAMAAVPVVEFVPEGPGYVRGVLVADRLDAQGFTTDELKYLEALATQVVRAAEAERLVGELHQLKDSQERLQRAAEELNRVATVEDVAKATARLAMSLVPGLVLSAVTRTQGDGRDRTHQVCAAVGERAGDFEGLEFDDNDGLVAHVVRLGAPLPARAPGLLERVRVFDDKVGGLGALRVLPLMSGGRVLGTLVVGTKARGALEGEARRRLESLGTLASGAFARALALEDVARLATVDPLTGLANRRQLETLSVRALAESVRYGRPASVVVTDVDHFKKVNDVHGHQAGDDVLRHIGAVLADEARNTDIAARYGGEEFVLVLPGTDEQGARELAERVRRRIENESIATTAGALQVTLSLGIAVAPQHGESLDALVGAADEALYEAKREGRNRTVLARRPAAATGS